VATNNVAEYSALVAGLERAVELGLDDVEVISDSELLVKQMTGEYKVRSAPLQDLYCRCKALTREFDWFSIRHIPREENSEADHLANVAMDSAMIKRRRELAAQRERSGSVSTAAAASKASNRNERPEPAFTELEGVVRDGVVELQGTTSLPEGTRVKVRIAR
jgi:hypothetical protein